MNARQTSRLDALIASGSAPTSVSSGAALARQGTRFQTLVDAAGQLSAAGTYYQERTGQELAVGGYDNTQAPTRSGDTEYIAMRDGTQ